MVSLAITLLSLLGLAAWLPEPLGNGRPGRVWIGLRMFAALAVLVLASMVADLLGASFHVTAWAIAIAAAAGLVRLAVTAARERAAWHVVAIHPVIVFPLVAAGLIALRGGLVYEPLAWDEVSIWAAVAQQGVGLDSFTGPGITAGVVGYTPGWPMALGYSSAFFGSFDHDRAAIVPFVMHVALLGLLYDVLRFHLDRAGWSGSARTLGAWATVLGLLAVEASWKLAPLNLLIEKPQIYSMIACLALASLAIEAKVSSTGRAKDWIRPSFHLGLALAFGYALKSAMLAFAPAVLVLWAGTVAVRRDLSPRAWIALALTIGPFVALYALWSGLGPKDSSCLVSPLGMIPTILSGSDAERSLDLARRLFGTIAEYLAAFKPGLTVAAVVGALVALTDRRLAVVMVSLAAYVVLYEAALYFYHLYCFSPYYFETLNSWDRFTRVPLRVLHVMGLVLGFIRVAPLLAGLVRSRSVLAGLGVVVVVGLGAWQIMGLHGQFNAMATRANETPEQVSLVRETRIESAKLSGFLVAHPDLAAEVRIVAQGDTGYRLVIANYHLWAATRVALKPPFSWAAAERDIWTVTEDPIERMMRASLVWPLVLDDWMREILAARIDDPHCRADIGRYYLVPEPDAGRFRCMAKPQ